MTSSNKGCARLPQVLIILIVATLFAAGLFLAIPYLRGRPQLPRGTYNLNVEGRNIRVVMDPEQEVYLLPIGGASATGTGGESLVAVPTATQAVLPSAVATTLPTPLPPTAPIPTATTPARGACVIFSDYRVASGDTLYSISRRFVTSVALMARHGISSVSLTPGNVIRVPVGDPACCNGGWRPYVVLEADTWFNLARTNGVTVEQLQQASGLGTGATLYMTDVICIP